LKKIKVCTESKSYNIFIGSDSFLQIKNLLKKPADKHLIICDKNVYQLHRKKIDSLINANSKTVIYVFNSEEKNKNLKSVESVYNVLLKNKFSRSDDIIAIGGGIVGDVSGFIASTFMRGIKYFQVPTTLLSMVDSSVGGKTGVNFNNVKNLIGTFYQPEAVFIDNNFLTTLPQKEIISGAGEIFKYAFLSDDSSYNFIRKSLSEIVVENKFNEKLITHCIRIKSSVVESDEKETSGLRKILNLGHTFAHAFESVLNYKIKHGEAVICGIIASLIVSEKLGLISKDDLIKYENDFVYLPLHKGILKAEPKAVISLMKSDKKTSDGKIKLVLVSKPGEIFIDVEVKENILRKSLEELKKIIRSV